MRARMGSSVLRTLGPLAMVALLGGVAPSSAEAQVRWRDLVVTLGGSVEGYAGNLANVAAAVVDSANGKITDHVVAVVGEMGVRGSMSMLGTPTRSFDVSFDGGLRQAAAVGFERQDYAPREWAGSASARLNQAIGSWGSLLVGGRLRGRQVQDRPPMPMFVQPGYSAAQGTLGVVTRALDGVSLDVQADVEWSDYRAFVGVPQIDLLDRRSSGLEAGVRWGGGSTVRFYGGYRWTSFRNQLSGDEEDPHRRDHTARVGLEWTYSGSIFAQVGADGTLNRSNSLRPEYDALSVRALLTAPLPHGFSANLYALLSVKSYTSDIDFARLVPGEEADNASIAYFQLGRPMASNLDGAFRLGWTRAETDFGNAYYRRFGASVQFNYRPMGF